MQRTLAWLSCSIACAALVLGFACSTPDAHSKAAPNSAHAKPPPKPWTSAFNQNTLIVADELRIEGPAGLLEHVVVTQSNEFFEHEERVVPEGLLQITRVKPDAPTAPAIRVRLDAWTADVLRQVTIVERVAEGPVTLDAGGSVYLHDVDAGSDQRAATMHFSGARP